MKTVKQTYLIRAPIDNVWQALTDSSFIDKWGGGPATMNDKVGTKFKLWGGDIHGQNLKVVKNKLLVQDWFSGEWKKPSKVTFTLEEKDGATKVSLLHENVPDDEEKDIADGWKEYYLDPLKDLVEK